MTKNLKGNSLLSAATILALVALGVSTLILRDKEQTTTQSETLQKSLGSKQVAQVDEKQDPTKNAPLPFLSLVKDAEVVCSKVVSFDKSKQQTERVRIYKTKRFKYPVVRTEETVIKDSNGKDKIVRAKAMVGDHILVRKKKHVSSYEFEDFCKRSGGKIRNRMQLSGLYLVSFDNYDVNTVQQRIRQFKDNHDFVGNVEPDYIVYAVGAPDDSSFDDLWGLHNTGQTGGTSDADIDAVEAWDISVGSRNVLVGIIDTGMDYTHPDLAANVWTNPNEIAGNHIDDDGNGFIDDIHGWDFANYDNDPIDDDAHGTHCAGTIGGVGNNGAGVAGVNWEVSMAAIKFLGSDGGGTTSDGIESIYYATSIGCSVTSNSWGGGGFSAELEAAIEDANANGILFVAAAGNSSSDNDRYPHYPSSYECENIIAVAATDHNDAKSSFSCYGPTSVDLAAPGTDILSTFPTFMTSSMMDYGFSVNYGTISGTSMATPHVSGVCALVKSVAPNMTHLNIKNQVLSMVDRIPSMYGRCVTGGRLNAYSALLTDFVPIMIRRSFVIDDSAGNGDGYINPGEQIDLDIIVANAGPLVAEGVTATIELAEASPYITLIRDTVAIGTVAAQTDMSLPEKFAFAVGAGQPTPATITINLTFTDRFDDEWTSSLDLTINTTSIISGVVETLATPATPIAGATITYVGPIRGETVSAADGTYTLKVVEGTYSITASADDYSPSAAIELTTPPDHQVVDFALGAPQIAVTPSSIVETSVGGQTITKTLTIRNEGNIPLDFQIRGTALVADEVITAVSPKLSADTMTPAVMPMAVGGPDEFGYEWKDSDDIRGPAYVWQDISRTSTPLPLGNDSYMPFDLGFDFAFYGNTFSTLYIGSNGYVTFGEGSTERTEGPLPNTGLPRNLIAALFDDLDPEKAGHIYAHTDSKKAIIQYQGLPFRHSLADAIFQIVLHKSGDIYFYYQRLSTTYPSYGVGIQNDTRDDGLQIAYHEAYLKDELAIHISPQSQWLSTSHLSGTVPAGGEREIEVTLNSTDLFADTYTGELVFENNALTGPITVPVELTVTGPYVVERGMSVDDDNISPSAGDGDGVAEPGEIIELQSLVWNDGNVIATGLSATLTTSDPYLAIIRSTAALPDLAPDTTAQLDSPFIVEVLPTCPSGYVADALITFADDAGHTWVSDYSIEVAWNFSLSGQVTDLANGTPIADATVRSGLSLTTTDSGGNYVLTDLTVGTHTVTVEKTGFFASSSQDITVSADATLDFLLGAAQVSVVPGSITETNYAGESAVQTLTIRNDGSLPLNFQLDGIAQFETLGPGGPDNYGYRWSDSDEPDGPAYVWNDISSTGTRLPISVSGDQYCEVDFGSEFSFRFYGNVFTEVYVNVSGYVTFGKGSSDSANNELPSRYDPRNLIAGFFDTFHPGAGNDVYVQVDSDKVTIQYQDVALYDREGFMTFQIVLHKSGGINFYYKELFGKLTGCTIGIQNADRDDGLLIAHNEIYLHPGLAVQIASGPKWLSASPSNATVAAGSEMDLDITLNAAELTPDIYSTTLKIFSNDPQTPYLPVPVTFNVAKMPPEIQSAWADPEIVILPGTTQVSITADDPNGNLLTYHWKQLSGPGTAIFSTDDLETSQVSFDTTGTYVLSVTVSNGINSVDSEVSVLVKESQEFPVEGKWYFIENKYHTFARLKYNQSYTPVVVQTTDESDACKWQFIKSDNTWYIQNSSGRRLRDGNGYIEPEMVSGSMTDQRALWNVQESTSGQEYWITSEGLSEQRRLSTNRTFIPNLQTSDNTGKVTQWEIVETTAPAITPIEEGKWYFIENKLHSLARLKCEDSTTPVAVATTDESNACKWQFIKAGDAWFIQNANGKRLQDGNGSDDPEMIVGTTTGVRAQWEIEECSTPAEFWITSKGLNAQTRIRTDDTAVPDMCASTLTGAFTKWEIVSTTPPVTSPILRFIYPLSGDRFQADPDMYAKIDAAHASGIEKIVIVSQHDIDDEYSWQGSATEPPYWIPMSRVWSGRQRWVAVAYLKNGERMTAEIMVDVTLASIDPMLTITSPSDGDQVLSSQDLIVKTDVWDNSGIKKVDLWSKEEQAIEETWHGAMITAPYEWNLGQLPVGNYALIAKALAHDGVAVTKEINITVIPGSVEPTITITSPADRDQLLDNQDVNVTIDADDDNGIERVDLWSKEAQATDWTWHGVVTTNPYEWNLGQLPVGTYTLNARAKSNDGGSVTTEINITVIPGSIEPTVTITSPSDGDQVPDNQNMIITANASDDSGIAKVHLWSKEAQATSWTYHGVDTASPYEWNIDVLPAGRYELNAKAIANDGGAVTTGIIIDVVPRNIAPVITALSATPSTINLSQTTTASVVATDADGDALTYRWTLQNGSGNATFTSVESAVTDVSFDAPGTYTLGISVSDGTVTTTAGVDVTVIDSIDPTVTITSHSNGDQIPGNRDVIVTADASDDSGIERVELWSKGELDAGYTWQGEITAAPYEWNLGQLPVGIHLLMVKAFANDGGTSDAEVYMAVTPTDPEITITSHADNDQVPDNQDLVVIADASDDSDIAKVHLWSKEAQATSWTYHGVDTASPYEWNIGALAVGTYELNAKAIANDGGTITTGITIEVIAGSTDPAVAITSHSDGDQVPGDQDVVITANASDDSGIQRVRLWSKETQATTWTYHGSVTAAPYEWNLNVLPAGTYKLSVKADSNDGTSVTEVITITVVP